MMGLHDCRTVARQLSRELDDQNSSEKRTWRLRLHLLMCHHCRRYARQLHWMSEAIRSTYGQGTPHSRLSDAARARIARRIHDTFDDEDPP